ncbi:multi-sensor signal transduction histidine kinase [Halogeometricum pallidum JCM 14848]|uniref:histidine kinase n=1 Tax=Halogeometricum pallidum JCM 14848 TaxID=1227487 RepID=M0D5T5_HALPD|nr:MEDS domain-containing protein [Halogeometricum pallidum]ELZ30840.1 multi-sensor signal transduction histidine kinase [Halogeometricum pallidum JCM 14848]
MTTLQGSGDREEERTPEQTDEKAGGSRTIRGPTGPEPAGHDHDGGHQALVYEDRDEQFDAVASFLRRGLELGEQCLYVADDGSPDAILAELRDRGIDVDAALDSGALAVVAPPESRRPGGEFDREAMLEFWHERLADVASGGYGEFRATAEMTLALDGESVPEGLVEYEAMLDSLAADDQCSLLCQYDRTRFPDGVIDEVIETHPLIAQGETVSENIYYTPPEEVLGPDRPGDRVDRRLRTLREQEESRVALRDHERDLHALYEVVADVDGTFEEKLLALMDLGCERFDMEMGGLARVDSETDRFEVEVTNGDHEDLVPGSEYPLSETYCRVAVADGGTRAITDTEEFEENLCYEQFGVRTYLGTHLEFDDADDRTFWFVSRRPREEISAADEAFHHLMGQWVRYELEKQRRTDQFVALDNLNQTARDINRELAEQSTREEVEQVVCDRFTESDSYAFAWFGTVEGSDVVPSTDATHPDAEEILELGAGGLAARAARTGDTQVLRDTEVGPDTEPWQELARRGITGVASIPVAYEDERYGVLTVYTTRERAFDEKEREILTQLGEIVGLAIAVIDHERELTHERERLEFFNRLVRHNLLNSLNVVRARVEMLEGAVDPEAATHLETVETRTDEMIDLVGKVRTLMRAVDETDERDLEPTDLGTALGAEVERTRRAFDCAEFDVGKSVAGAGTVLADDLLTEAFENLLVNAVQHNDKETPRVWVDVETSERETTVRIADNGPGVDDEVRAQMFEKGRKGLKSNGTGFGLYLTREIIESYGGEIRVEDRDPEGTVFSISLPRAESA